MTACFKATNGLPQREGFCGGPFFAGWERERMGAWTVEGARSGASKGEALQWIGFCGKV